MTEKTAVLHYHKSLANTVAKASQNGRIEKGLKGLEMLEYSGRQSGISSGKICNPGRVVLLCGHLTLSKMLDASRLLDNVEDWMMRDLL